MSSAELTEWQAFEEVAGPLGPERSDVLTAMIVETIVRVNVDQRHSRSLKTADFLPAWHREAQSRPKQTPEQIKTMMRALRS